MVDSVYVTPSNAATIKATAAANTPPAAPPVGIKVNNAVGKTASITFKNGAVASSEVSTIQTATAKADTSVNSERAGQPVQGKSGFGRPLVPSEINDKSEIDVGSGFTTSLASAKASGLVTQDAHGNWVYAGNKSSFNPPSQARSPAEAKPNEQQPQPKQDDAPQADHIEPLDDRSEALMKDVVAKVPGPEAQSYAKEIIETGTLSQQAIAKFAERFGISTEQATNTVEHVREAFTAQASKTIGPLAENVFTWARNHASKELRAAIDTQVNQGSTKGFTAIANKFVLTLPDHSPDIILNSPDAVARGIRREPDGSITINDAKHGRVEWKNAIRIGLIKPFLPK